MRVPFCLLYAFFLVGCRGEQSPSHEPVPPPEKSTVFVLPSEWGESVGGLQSRIAGGSFHTIHSGSILSLNVEIRNVSSNRVPMINPERLSAPYAPFHLIVDSKTVSWPTACGWYRPSDEYKSKDFFPLGPNQNLAFQIVLKTDGMHPGKHTVSAVFDWPKNPTGLLERALWSGTLESGDTTVVLPSVEQSKRKNVQQRNPPDKK